MTVVVREAVCVCMGREYVVAACLTPVSVWRELLKHLVETIIVVRIFFFE